MTADEFRELALALEGVEERAHMGHPDFRVNGRIFATLHTSDRTGMAKRSRAEQAELVRRHPKAFDPSAGAWGRQGCTNVTLAAAPVGAVHGALLAWQGAAAKPPARKAPRSR